VSGRPANIHSKFRVGQHTGRAIAAIAAAVAVAGYLLVGVLVTIGATPTSLKTPAAFALVLVWSALVAEPIARFWIVSRDVPAVRRSDICQAWTP